MAEVPSTSSWSGRDPLPPDADERVDEEFIQDHTVQPTASAMIPEVFCWRPPVRDGLVTKTSVDQDETVEKCLPFMSGDNDDAVPLNDQGVPGLDRPRHARFLRNQLGRLPGPFLVADASRPWFLYWCLNGLSLLGEDVSAYRDGLVETVRSMQNASGGFGGGHGQYSHLATTYAVVLALALVGGEECFEVVDRRSMWKWLCTLKQPDGGFQVTLGGEEDIRGAYCAAVIIRLLNIPLDLTRDSPAWVPEGSTLLTGLAEYVRRCQTFEGGFSAQPDAEAHGAYAFCALGCLSLLDTCPSQSIPQYLDVPRLLSWLSSRQYAPEGGFSGRTNKLVDGCYSHWVGGCWPLIEACLNGPPPPPSSSSPPLSPSLPQPGRPAAAGLATTGVTRQQQQQHHQQQKLPSCERTLFSREGLIRYILCCCQDQTRRGGLRDKPDRPSDAYHSCYVLSGLSSAQHKWELGPPPRDQPMDKANSDDSVIVNEDYKGDEAAAASAAGDILEWMVSPHMDEVQVFDEEDRVGTLHPVYAIPEKRAEVMKAYFAAKVGF